MKMSTVFIKRNRPGSGWYVDYFDLVGDRVSEGHAPHSCGKYHYPTKMGRLKAFELLKAHLIADRVEKIRLLNEEIESLKMLQHDSYGTD